MKKAASGTFGLIKKGFGCIWPAAKTALAVVGVERIAEMTYEKVTGNEINWNFNKNDDSFGVTIEKQAVYVGENSTTSADEGYKRGDELDYVSNNSSTTNDMGAELS